MISSGRSSLSARFPVDVVDVAACFPPKVIGNALAKMWVVDQQNLVPSVYISGDLECPITLEQIENPALLCDGTVYEEVAIKRWLQDNNTVPCTNLPLDHRKILRLEPLKAAFEHFLFQNDVVKPCAEQTLKDAIWDLKTQNMDPCTYVRKFDILEVHIASATRQIESLQELVTKAQAIVAEMTAGVYALKLNRAVRLQAFTRGFLARREAKRRKIAKAAASSEVVHQDSTDVTARLDVGNVWMWGTVQPPTVQESLRARLNRLNAGAEIPSSPQDNTSSASVTHPAATTSSSQSSHSHPVTYVPPFEPVVNVTPTYGGLNLESSRGLPWYEDVVPDLPRWISATFPLEQHSPRISPPVVSESPSRDDTLRRAYSAMANVQSPPEDVGLPWSEDVVPNLPPWISATFSLEQLSPEISAPVVSESPSRESTIRRAYSAMANMQSPPSNPERAPWAHIPQIQV